MYFIIHHHFSGLHMSKSCGFSLRYSVGLSTTWYLWHLYHAAKSVIWEKPEELVVLLLFSDSSSLNPQITQSRKNNLSIHPSSSMLIALSGSLHFPDHPHMLSCLHVLLTNPTPPCLSPLLVINRCHSCSKHLSIIPSSYTNHHQQYFWCSHWLCPHGVHHPPASMWPSMTLRWDIWWWCKLSYSTPLPSLPTPRHLTTLPIHCAIYLYISSPFGWCLKVQLGPVNWIKND